MIGQMIGNYRVIRKLGEGGMGAVYEATHTMLARRAAVKVLHAEISKKPELVARFINEAKASNIIGHPDIVDIFELGTLPSGEVFILMEYLDGESLGQRLKRLGRMSVQETLQLTACVANALAAAHQKGIIHRDLKPDNVMLLTDQRSRPSSSMNSRAAAPSIKLLDFGIAKLAAEHAGPDGHLHTGTGVMMGTPAYMSPEQCRGAGGVDDRTDVYALGVMIYQMLQGRPPFTGSGVGDLIVMHLTTPPPPLLGVPAEVNALVMRMLAKQAAERPAMVVADRELTRLGESLHDAALAPMQPMPLLQQQTTTPTMERHSYAAGAVQTPIIRKIPLWLIGAGTAALLVGGLGGVKRWHGQPPTADPSQGVHAATSEAKAIALIAPPRVAVPSSAEPARQDSRPPVCSLKASSSLSHVWNAWTTVDGDSFAVTTSGDVFRHDGTRWVKAHSAGAALYGVWGTSRKDVWAVGYAGLILHHDGIGWQRSPSGTRMSLLSIRGDSTGALWAVGHGGLLLKQERPGRWSRVDSGTKHDLVAMGDGSQGAEWIAGWNGTIIHREGSQWIPMDSGFRADLTVIWEAQPGSVWVAGKHGAIGRFDGRAWSKVTSGTKSNLWGIAGTSARSVWFGGEGVLLHWDGVALTPLASAAGNLINLSVTRAKEVIGVASDGFLIKCR